MKKLPLHTKIILGLLAGVLWALVGAQFGFSKFTLDWIAPFGTIFINLLKLIAIPLVLFSIITGILSFGDVRAIGRMGAKTLLFYLLTTTFAISVGLVLVNLFKPGKHIDENQRIANRISYELWLSQNPDIEKKDDLNLLQNPEYSTYLDEAEKSLAEMSNNEMVQSKMKQASSTKGSGPLQFIVDMVPSNIFLSFNDSLMLQVIFFALFFGLTLISLPPDKVAGMTAFCISGNEIFLKMVDLVMSAAPYFVFALMAGTMAYLAGDSPAAMLSVFQAL